MQHQQLFPQRHPSSEVPGEWGSLAELGDEDVVEMPMPPPWLGSVLPRGFHAQPWCPSPSRRAVPAQHTLPSPSGPPGANHRGPPRQRTTLTPNLTAASLSWEREGNCLPSGRAGLPWGGPVAIGWRAKGREGGLSPNNRMESEQKLPPVR